MTCCCCCMSVQSDSRHIKRKHTSSTGLTCLDFRMCVCLNEEIKGISEVDTWLHLTAAVQYQQSLTKSAGQNYKGCHYGPGTTTATTFACPQGVSHIHTLFVWLHSAEEMYSIAKCLASNLGDPVKFSMFFLQFFRLAQARNFGKKSMENFMGPGNLMLNIPLLY